MGKVMDLPTVACVIFNATHVAVALKFGVQKMAAPVRHR